MKLLIVGPYPIANNGMSEYIAQYRAELTAQGHEVATRTQYFWLHKATAFAWVARLSCLWSHFDAIIVQHTPTASGPLLPVFLWTARKRGKTVALVGHEPPSIYAKHLPARLRPLYFWYERTSAELARIRIVHTSFHADELRRIGVAGNIRVIPIPVYGKSLPMAWNKDQRPAWGYYGMISPKKGLEYLLQAYASRPPGHFPPLRILGGPAPGEENYWQRLRECVPEAYRPFIVFTGFLPESILWGEMQSISLMIFPYLWVSQSAALAQTVMQGIPFLASDLPYFSEFHAKYGCGELFRAGSVESLATVMEKVHSREEPYDQSAFDRVRHELSIGQAARRLVEVLEEEAGPAP